jgi:hypothetical protein
MAMTPYARRSTRLTREREAWLREVGPRLAIGGDAHARMGELEGGAVEFVRRLVVDSIARKVERVQLRQAAKRLKDAMR